MSCIPPEFNKKTPTQRWRFYQHVKRASRGKKLWTIFTPHTEMHTKLSLALHLANLTIIISS
jgi:hypothetical protein